MRIMKKVLTSVCALALALTVMVMPVSAAEFTDVSNHWAKDFAIRWGSAQIFSGYEDGSFGPEREVTRAEMAQVVYNLLGFASEDSRDYEKEFTDVTDSDWYRKAVLTCADEGIISGYDDGTFRPGMSITREQAFTLIIKGLGIDADQYLENADEYIAKFADADDVSEWAKKFVAALVAYNGIAGSYVGTELCVLPQKTITRGELAAVLDNLIAVYVDKKGEVSVPVSASDTGDAAEDYKGTFIIVNKEVEDTVEVSFTKDEIENKTVIEVKVGNEPAKTVAVSNEVLEDSGKNEEVKAPTLVQGITSVPMQEEQKVVVEKVEEEVGSEQPVEQKHLHMTGKVKNCAVTSDVANVCYTDPENCEYATVKTVPADVHKFVDEKCTVCGMEEKSDAMKFHANITSNNNYVDVNVTNDYAAKMVITPGKVDAAKATVTVEMQDVASMGVTGIRKEEKTFETGLTGDPELKVWLSEAFEFEGGNINATIEDKATTYKLVGEKEEDNAVITATPADVEDTREAWAELTSHIDSESKEVEDSYIVVANGSYMVVGNDMLSFEKGNVGDLTLDAFSTKGGMAALEEEIRSKVQLNTSDVFAKEGYEFQFYLAAGTKLAVSNSIATLADDCFITVNADSVAKNTELDKILPELQAAEGGYAMAEKLVKLLNQMIGCVDGDTIDVNITFSEPEAEKDTKFYFGVTAKNAEKPGTTTVDMEVYDDYSLEINLPMNKISASEVTLDVEMNNVASMGVTGTKKHTQTVNTGMTASGDLNFWMSNAPLFEKATIDATIADGDGEAKVSYALVSDMDADWVTITGTTDTEAARTAWAKIANNVATGENTKGDDSYILVNKNSFVQIGTEMLDFEDGADDMLLDNFSNLTAVKQEIKDSVKLVKVNESKIVLHVGAGTTLAVSESAATLEKDAEIVVSVKDAEGNIVAISEDALSKIQAAADDNNALVKELFTLLNNMVGSMNNGTVDVHIGFLEPLKECDHTVVCKNCAVTELWSCECGQVEDYVKEGAHAHTFVNDVCECCGMTEKDALKFNAKITSNGNYVEAVVTNDYTAQVTVTPGNVDASKVDLYVAMQNVAGLGVSELREESKTVSTGLSGNPELKVWLSNAFGFTSGKIEATVEGLPTGYELKGSTIDGNAVITATPANIEHTRAAWDELTDHVTATSQNSSDSYIEIANGSFMIVGDDMLSFEDGVEDNLKLDGFTAENGMDSIENEIRSKVKLTTDASLESAEYEAKFYLAKGTKLAIGNSMATLDENCTIKFSGEGLKSEDFADVLPKLQAAETGYTMAESLVNMINAMIGSANGNTINVDITFSEITEEAPVVAKTPVALTTLATEATEEVVEEVVEETTEEPVVEEVVEEETTEEPVVEEVVEEETTEEPVVEEVVEEATEELVVE